VGLRALQGNDGSEPAERQSGYSFLGAGIAEQTYT
jgi:hypothetical protein